MGQLAACSWGVPFLFELPFEVFQCGGEILLSHAVGDTEVPADNLEWQAVKAVQNEGGVGPGRDSLQALSQFLIALFDLELGGRIVVDRRQLFRLARQVGRCASGNLPQSMLTQDVARD